MSRVDALIQQGAIQVSRKYRKVFVYPEPCTEYLKKNHPEIYDRLVDRTLAAFESEARAIVWGRFGDGHTTELTQAEFDEFREKTTGRKPWSPEGKEPCPYCRSLGHMHRSTCPNA